MESAPKNSNIIALAAALLLAAPALRAQDGQPAPAPQPSQEAAASGAVGTALDYLFNRKPGDGTAAEQIGRAAGLVGDRALAQDSTGISGFNDPQIQARFAKYLSLK
jgi:hypothetical protein